MGTCLIVIIWVLLGPDLSAACPQMCICLNSTSLKVSCEGSGLTTLPVDLPNAVSSLDLTRNHFRILGTDSLGILPHLVDLKLRENGLEDIDEGAFHGVGSLQLLDLSGNNLTIVDRITFRHLSGLLHLDLSCNQLTEVDGAFAGLIDLSRLDLRQNRLSIITQSTLSGLSGLRYLRLDDNLISHIDSRALLVQQRLMYFVLKGNPIGHLSQLYFNSEFLSYVDISECGLVNVPKGLPGSVRYLQLRRNKLTALYRHSFEHCTNVTILVLDENGLEEVEPGALASMPHLQQLWLNGNRLRSVPRPLPPSVQRLFLDLNDVQELSEDDFPVASQLNTLSVMGNNISSLPSGAFRRLSVLRHLDLSGNYITHLRRSLFSGNPRLQLLQLSKNALDRLESGCFHGLRELHTLSMAYVPTLNPSLEDNPFLDLTNLRKLDLESSPGLIRTFVSYKTGLVSSLQELNLDNSDLVTLHADFAGRFPNLAVLRISSHSWRCDARLEWFKEWLMSTPLHVEDRQRNKCATPESLQHRAITSLSSSDFKSNRFEEVSPTADDRVSPDYLIPVSLRVTSVLFSKDLEARRYVDSETQQLHTPFPRPGWITASALGVSYGVDDKQRNVKLLTLDEILGADDSFYGEDGTKGSQEEEERKPYRKGLDDPVFPETRNSSMTSDGQTFYMEPPDSAHPKPSPGDGPGNTTTIVVTVTILVTVLAAVAMVTGIVYLCRRNSAKKVQCPQPVLSPAPPLGGASDVKSATDGYSLRTTSCGGRGGRSVAIMAMESGGEIVMSLVPGRDINHEGPLRVYKWEDF